MQTEQINGNVLETWTPEEVQSALDNQKIILIDVRTPAEYIFESVPGALLAPLSSFSNLALPADVEGEIVLYCGSAKRSRMAAEMCLSKGFKKIAHMAGGFGAWKQAGLTYLGTNMATGAPEKMKMG